MIREKHKKFMENLRVGLEKGESKAGSTKTYPLGGKSTYNLENLELEIDRKFEEIFGSFDT